MKPNYKNWVPKILIVGMALATAVSIAALVVFGVCGLWVTKTWRIILSIVFAGATIGCGKTLQWSITAYCAFSYDGKRQLSRKITQGTAEYITLPEGGIGLDVGCGSGALTIACAKGNPHGRMVGVDRWGKDYAEFSLPLCRSNATIGFFLDYAERSVREAMPGVSVDLSALAEKFCGKDSIYILRKHPSIEHIFSELYNVPAKIRMDYFKINVMELLVFLRALELSEHKDERPYFYSSQIEKIKAVHELLTDDLAKNYTTEELAKQFNLSVAALKTGFKGVYGSPIYTYIRTHKMNMAASMLVTDRKKRIIEIASAVGYDNPSKFAAAFKEIFGMTPAEYRNDRR